MWLGRQGDSGFARHVEFLWDLTDFMVQEIKRRADHFYLIWDEPECLNVCFWYVPARLRQTPHDASREEELGKVSHAQLTSTEDTEMAENACWKKLWKMTL